MKIKLNRHLIAALSLVCMVTPLAAYADDDMEDYYEKVQKAQKRHFKNVRKAQRRYDRSYYRTHWGDNWDDQREYYTYNFRNLGSRRANARQRALEAQLRNQYLMYNNNNYTGPYGWNQYSNPGFIDYLHMRSPGLLSSVRSIIGF